MRQDPIKMRDERVRKEIAHQKKMGNPLPNSEKITREWSKTFSEAEKKNKIK